MQWSLVTHGTSISTNNFAAFKTNLEETSGILVTGIFPSLAEFTTVAQYKWLHCSAGALLLAVGHVWYHVKLCVMPCYVTPIHLHNPLNGTICPILIQDFAKNCIFYASFGASLLLLRERLIRLKPWNMIPLLAMTLLFDPTLKPTIAQIFYNLVSVHFSCFLDKGLICLKFHYWPWPCHLIPPWSQTASQPQTKPASTSIWSWGKGVLLQFWDKK